jgi:pectate lyase
MMKKKHFSLIFAVLSYAIGFSQQLAFPGAEGFGRFSKGGRGGDVYHVANLNDDGIGSLRHGINSAVGARTIVFDVSGTIFLKSKLKVDKSNITLAGQTAPGDGITIAGNGFHINNDDIIVRYIRCRLGDTDPDDQDAISIFSGKNIILDHVSASWSIDETLSCQSSKIDSLTVQWCMITESLTNSHHEKGAHGYGGIIGATRQTFHHNLYAHHSSRSPKVTGRRHCEVDFRNNVIYNWGFNNCYDGTASYMNWVNNYYKAGPATKEDKKHRIFQLSDQDISSEKNNRPEDSRTFETSLYAEGNYVDGFQKITENNWKGGIDFDNGATEEKNRALKPFNFPPITEQSAADAYPLVLKNAGASYVRDVIDLRIVEEVFKGTTTYGRSGLIDSQNDTGGWPKLLSLPVPIDTDQDGMPDSWEIKNNLDPRNPDDRNSIKNKDGYTNLENYLNQIAFK